MYNYSDKIYFSLYASCRLITDQRDPKRKNCETGGQKLSQLYHLQFDAAEIRQSRPFELPDYCK